MNGGKLRNASAGTFMSDTTRTIVVPAARSTSPFVSGRRDTVRSAEPKSGSMP
jgi:hypothetical protein